MIFRGVVRHVVDGDTIDVFLDLGFNQYSYQTIRVRDLNTPELVGTVGEDRKKALDAKAFLESLFRRNPEVSVVTFRDKTTFGRYLADVSVCFYGGQWEDLATLMKSQGFHVEA
jgi:endonuclease YncB( thermonuclease family)